MIYAETPRLRLRALRREDFGALVHWLNDWEVARWLAVPPFPYLEKDAEDFFRLVSPSAAATSPEFFALAGLEDDRLRGGIGMHPAREDLLDAVPGADREAGYWLARPFQGQGLMREAFAAALALAFAVPDVRRIAARTDPANAASNALLKGAGFSLRAEAVTAVRTRDNQPARHFYWGLERDS